jgi:hypothetical protein
MGFTLCHNAQSIVQSADHRAEWLALPAILLSAFFIFYHKRKSFSK